VADPRRTLPYGAALDPGGVEVELYRIRRLLEEMHAGMADLLSTTRFSRGGYDGPFLRGQLVTLAADGPPAKIVRGGEFPKALLLEAYAVGGAGDNLRISDDPGMMATGYIIGLAVAHTLDDGNPIRLVVDRAQDLWAQYHRLNPMSPDTVQLRVKESRN
jgi:hypothetical protein